MMRGLLLSLSLSAGILVAFGCASASSGGGGGTSYRKDLGTVTAHDFSRYTRLILQRYNYEMEQEDSSTNYQQFKTRWDYRNPHQDEIELGVVEIRTQLTVRARSRGAGGAGSAGLQTAELIAQNMARVQGSTEWVLTVMSPMFKEYIDEIAGELKTKFSSGIRVYDR